MTEVRAAVSYGDMTTRVEHLSLPDSDDEAGLLRVELSGVCGSDWPMYQTLPKFKGPLILGHEAVGVVERLGRSAARRFGVKEGDRVALEEYLPCGHCRYCRTGDFRLCDETDAFNNPEAIRLGSTPVRIAPALWGGYSEIQYLHPNSVFHHIPDNIPATMATLSLPLGNGVEWAVLQGQARIGECVVIQGPGQQGLACVVAAKEAGAAKIIVTGLSSGSDVKRLAIAQKLGADHVVLADKENVVAKVADLTGGDMADLVINCAPGGGAVAEAIRLVHKRGRVLLGGLIHGPMANFDSDQLVKRFLTVKGMRGHSFQAVELAIGIMKTGKYPLEELCTHVFPLDRTHDALTTVGGVGEVGAIHVCVDPTQ